MRITFKLFATLSGYLPHELDGHRRVDNQIDLDVSDGTAVQAVIDRFAMPQSLIHLVLVNGNPAREISDIRKPVAVIKDGVVYRSAELYGAMGVR